MSNEKQQDNFFWPISREEINAVIDSTIRELINLSNLLVNQEQNTARDILYALTPTIQTEIVSLYRVQTFLNRSSPQNIALLDKGRLFNALSKNSTPNPPSMLNYLRSGPHRPKLIRAPARFLRGIFMSYIDSIIRYPIPSLNECNDITTIALSPLIEAHAASSDNRVVYRSAHLWFDEISQPVKQDTEDLLLIKKVLDITQHAFKAGAEEASNCILIYQKEWLAYAFRLARSHLTNLEGRSVKIPKKLWTGSGMWIWSRLLKPKVYRNGGHITGHDHGTGAGYRNDPYKAYREFDYCNRFVTFGPGHGKGYKDCFSKDLNKEAELPEINWMALPKRSPTERALQRSLNLPWPNKIKKVLFVSGISDNDDSSFFIPMMSNIQLRNWYVRLLSYLGASSFQIYWKPHRQDAHLPTREFLDEMNIFVVDGVVEELYGEVDALLFDSFFTTAFMSGISSGRPLVLIDFGYQALTHSARSLLAKRAAIVNGRFNEKSQRPEIDWNSLDRSLRRDCLLLSDTKFRDSYIRPAKRVDFS